MSHPIQVPDELYAAITDYARQHGEPPDAIIAARLKQAVERAKTSGATETPQEQAIGQDPLALLAGIINIPGPDAGDQHDAYFGGDDSHNDASSGLHLAGSHEQE